MKENRKKYSLNQSNAAYESLKKLYEKAKQGKDYSFWKDLGTIFQVAYDNKRFPDIICSIGNAADSEYIEKWVRNYENAMLNRPSRREAKPKTTCTDPITKYIVKTHQELTEDEAAQAEYAHEAFMSAENIQGLLLEEYIDASIRKHGFVWCVGNVLRAVDFCSKDGSVLIQVKNKDNTENSSSSAIREGSEIKKWHRLGKTKSGDKYEPKFMWDDLNHIVNGYKGEGSKNCNCNMNEKGFRSFLTKTISNNPKLLMRQDCLKRN